MAANHYRQQVRRADEEISRLQTERARESEKVADANRKAATAQQGAIPANSASLRASKMRQAQRYQEAAAKAEKRVAALEDKIAQAQRKRFKAEQSLHKEKERDDRRRQDETSRRDQSASTPMCHDQPHAIALSAMRRPVPERITVLFLAANPLDQEQLRLDEEVRSIGDKIRSSDHHDAVRLESRWAVRPLDVCQAINECKPTVLHISGHGTEDEIVFQDDAGRAKRVSKEAMVQTMAAASTIQLVFFNTCYSRDQAQAVVAHVAAAIGMNASMGDDAARVFSAAFYSAIGFGHSILRAFGQAKTALMLQGIPEACTPELFVAEGLDPDELVLVKAHD